MIRTFSAKVQKMPTFSNYAMILQGKATANARLNSCVTLIHRGWALPSNMNAIGFGPRM
jgi:hypothetical protein